ncbi:hypothetical protein EMCRGX_G033310 [Ephydatia muelleri]
MEGLSCNTLSAEVPIHPDTMHQKSALGGMVTCESCQAKRAYFSSNEWNASMDIMKPGLIAYETMLPRKRSHREKRCILASWRHSGSKRILAEYSITRYHHSSLILIT